MADPKKSIPDEEVRKALPLLRRLLAGQDFADVFEAAETVNVPGGGEVNLPGYTGRGVCLHMPWEVADTADKRPGLIEKARFLAQMIGPQHASAKGDELGITLVFRKRTYDTFVKPRYHNERIEDRIYRLLDHCGYHNITHELRAADVEADLQRFSAGDLGQGGDTGRGR